MSYLDRLRGSITLVSPETQAEFNASWVGNERSKQKNLGEFEYVDVNGTVTQDNGISGTRYPLTIFFPGPDNDLESDRFFITCDERGPWTVTHPLLGEKNLQLVSVAQRVRPIEDGLYTAFDTQWIEPASDATAGSAQQDAAAIDQQVFQLNDTANGQYADNLNLDTAGEQITNANAIRRSVTRAAQSLGDIAALAADVQSEFLAIQRGIQDTLDDVILKPIALAGQVQNLTQLPALAVDSVNTRLDGYTSLSVAMGLENPDQPTAEQANRAYVQELVQSAIIGALGTVATTGIFTTRSEAVNAAEDISDLFDSITTSLDAAQSLYDSSVIDLQYFSQSDTYADAAKLVGQIIAYLFRASLDLAIEKRFTLDRPRAPIEIAITEYGSLGDNDENYNFFCDTNGLSGNDVLLLPAGSEVVVYV